MTVLLQAQPLACLATRCLLHGKSSRLRRSRLPTLTLMAKSCQALGHSPPVK